MDYECNSIEENNSEDEAEIRRREVLQCWRDYRVRRIKIYDQRVVGSLTLAELERLHPWFQNVERVWPGVDLEIKSHYWALQEARTQARAEQQTAGNEVQAGPPEPALKTGPQSPGGTEEESVPEKVEPMDFPNAPQSNPPRENAAAPERESGEATLKKKMAYPAEPRLKVNYGLMRELIANNAETILREYFPQAQRDANELKIADWSGAKGNLLGIQIRGPKEKIGLWHDRATGEGGTLPKLLCMHFGIDDAELARRLGARFGINLVDESYHHRADAGGVSADPIDFGPYVSAFGPEWQELFRSERGCSQELVDCLIANRAIGVAYSSTWMKKVIVFPIADPETGEVFRYHCWSHENRDWRCEPFTRYPLTPLILGDPKKVVQVHFHESQFDAFAQIDIARAFDLDEMAFIATRGAQNVKHLESIRDQIRSDAQIVLWPQHDVADAKGKVASTDWLSKMKGLFKGRRGVCIAWIPDKGCGQKFDLNDWLRSESRPGPTDVEWAIENAELIELSKPQLHGGNGQHACPYPAVDWAAISRVGQELGQRFVQEVVYPEGSILKPYMDFARTVCESSETHLLGAIIPVAGALLARRVYISWPQRNIYPNLFSLLVGPAGQRKSDAVKVAAKVAQQLNDSIKQAWKKVSEEKQKDLERVLSKLKSAQKDITEHSQKDVYQEYLRAKEEHGPLRVLGLGNVNVRPGSQISLPAFTGERNRLGLCRPARTRSTGKAG